MKSQKITNKPPRPFKSGSSTRGWGGQDAGFIPGQKPAPKLKKAAPAPPPLPAELPSPASVSETEQGAGASEKA